MKKVVLAEKPSVGKELARVLGCNENKGGALYGKDYIVTWALGHLVTLSMPEEMNKEWSTWKEETLPMIPTKFQTKVIPQTSKQFNVVKNILKNDDVVGLIIATDAGREGELVARWIIEKCGFNKPMERLWISSMTDKAIKEGFNHLVSAKEYDRLYLSALARAKADWLVGLNVTRALTVKYNASLSAGRVQTPTLSLIVERENEILNFKKEPYYTVHTKINNLDFALVKNNNILKISNNDDVNKIINDLKKNDLIVSAIDIKEKKEYSPLLYDLTSLQQDANKLYAFSAKHTLDIMQRLYEVHKVLTYPRTDSKYLSTDMYDTIKDRLLNSSYGDFQKYARAIVSRPLSKSKNIFDNSKIGDHHAIIPTELRPNIMALETDEKRIFDLVVKRFISVFMDPYIYESTTITLKNNEYLFKGSYSKPVSFGFKELNKEPNQNINASFNYKINDRIINPSYISTLDYTKPKERFTEATLLYAMEHASEYTKDSSEKKALSDVQGIGTPATRAEIIERIFNAGYVKLVGKSIYPTEKGKQLISLVPKELRSVSFTAVQEMNLEEISKGKMHINSFIDSINDYTRTLTNEVLNSESKYHHDNMTRSKCPVCGKMLLDVTNKFGKQLVCMDKTCGYKKKIYQITNLRCPTCHKRLKQYGEKDDITFACECGYKEKKDRFFEKINENHQGMNKKQVKSYMNKMEEEVPTNNPFAEIFKDK